MRRQAIAPVIRAVPIEKSVMSRSIAIPLGTQPPSLMRFGSLVASNMGALLAGGRSAVKARAADVECAACLALSGAGAIWS